MNLCIVGGVDGDGCQVKSQDGWDERQKKGLQGEGTVSDTRTVRVLPG